MQEHPCLNACEPAFTAGEIAARLRIHSRTVHRLIKRGRLQAIKIGREYRIFQHAYEAFLAQQGPRASIHRRCRAGP